jgi:hypothetical protein
MGSFIQILNLIITGASEIIPGPVGRAIKTRRQRVLEWLRRLFFR